MFEVIVEIGEMFDNITIMKIARDLIKVWNERSSIKGIWKFQCILLSENRKRGSKLDINKIVAIEFALNPIWMKIMIYLLITVTKKVFILIF